MRGQRPNWGISIHALLAESDIFRSILLAVAFIFLSTLSLRRATKISGNRYTQTFYFYPRSPCGERRLPTALRTPHHKFLSTLSLRRATRRPGQTAKANKDFYPRSPCGERLWDLTGGLNCDGHFYPRSPCGERPRGGGFAPHFIPNFYPRSPCGERRAWTLNINGAMVFLSTLSLRRATCGAARGAAAGVFLSTLSLRRATHLQRSNHPHNRISIHALLAESDFGRAFWPGLSF